MINGEIVRVKVIGVERYPSNEKNRAYYTEKEALDVINEGGQKYKLTRFRKKSQNRIAVGYVYQGEQVQSKNPEKFPIDTLENVDYIDGGFHGTASEDWPLPDNEEMDARQKSILVQSDMRTSALLMQYFSGTGEYEDWMSEFRHIYEWIKRFREEQEKS